MTVAFRSRLNGLDKSIEEVPGAVRDGRHDVAADPMSSPSRSVRLTMIWVGWRSPDRPPMPSEVPRRG